MIRETSSLQNQAAAVAQLRHFARSPVHRHEPQRAAGAKVKRGVEDVPCGVSVADAVGRSVSMPPHLMTDVQECQIVSCDLFVVRYDIDHALPFRRSEHVSHDSAVFDLNE
jgi:hypothetical protein